MKPANLPCVYLQPSLLYLLYVLLSYVKTVNIQMKITRFLTEAVSWKSKTFLIVKIWYVLGFEQKFSGYPIASQFVNYFWSILLFRVITGYLWDCFMPILCFFHYQRKVGMARLLLLFDIVKKISWKPQFWISIDLSEEGISQIWIMAPIDPKWFSSLLVDNWTVEMRARSVLDYIHD